MSKYKHIDAELHECKACSARRLPKLQETADELSKLINGGVQ